MITTISNEHITIEVNTLGAELWSLKKTGEDYEYLWQGNPEYWTGRSPVLFPIVGACIHSEMKVDGELYPIGNHGFSRKTEFQLIQSDDSKLVYQLVSNEDTLKMYPFKFDLRLTYTLEGSQVIIGYEVINTDHNEIYFQIGTHPGFNVPMDEGLNFDDYYISFDVEESARRHFFDGDNLLVTNKDEDGLKGRQMALKHELFYEGATIFRGINSKELILKSDKGQRQVKLSYDKFSYLGVWQMKDAPYVCIEPWTGISDPDNYTGEFKDKEMMMSLDVGKDYSCYLAIEI